MTQQECPICGPEHSEARHWLLVCLMLGTWWQERQPAQPTQPTQPRKWSEAEQRIARKRERERTQ